MGRTLSSDSANVIALPASPSGFTAGDYVYQTRSGYGIVPAGALATGMFDVGNLPALVSTSTATTYNELTYVEQLGGSQGSQVAAQLTNGNIVYTYATGNPASYGSAATVNFRIETTSGTPVVAETSTTMTVFQPSQVSVIALPAGGFAIVATTVNSGTLYNLSARFYNADGTTATAVLTGPVNITGNTTTVSRLKLQPLTDGSVIIGYINGNDFELRRLTTAGFDSAFGTAGVAAVQTYSNGSNWWDFVTDSSNNIHTISNTSTTLLAMRRYNSSGVQQTTSNVASLTGIVATAIAISSSGTIRGFAQDGTGVIVITWNGTTAAVGTRIITATSPAGGALGVFAQGASGGYVVFYNTALTGNSAIGLYFQAFSSSDVALASAVRVNPAIAVCYRIQFVPIVVSGNTRVYFGVYQYNNVNMSLSNNSSPMGIAYFTYSNTTYALAGSTTTNYNFGSQGPYALGDYMRGVSTADTARFTIVATGPYTASYAAGATVIPKTLIDGSNATLKPILCPLTNGEFVAVWARNTGQTYISKYSASGVLQIGPVAVYGTGGNGNATYATSAATFANGNILVTYADNIAGATLRYRIYDPSLTVVTSGNIDTSYAQNNATSASFGDGSHVAVAYSNGSNNIVSKVVRSDGTVTTVGNTMTATTNWQGLQIIGFKSSSFIVAAFANDGLNYVWGYVVRQTGATTFSSMSNPIQLSNSSFNTIGLIASNPTPSLGTTGYFIGNNTSNNAIRVMSVNPLARLAAQLSEQNFSGSPFTGGITTNVCASVTYTPNGTPVLVTSNIGSSPFSITLSPFSMAMSGSTISTTGSTVTTLSAGVGQFGVSAIPHIGEAVLIGYCDTSGYPAFASIAASTFNATVTLTAGTDISTSTLGLTSDSGYSLQGIAATTATSGNIGLVQTRGTATLNSNYSAATPATLFDFRNQLTFGISGMILGRTVTIRN